MTKTTTPALQAWTAPHQQSVFRQLMHAFSYPGRIQALDTLEAEAGAAALTQILATLLDGAATLADPEQLVPLLTRQRLQAIIVEAASAAQFVVANGSTPPGFTPCLGTLESPEQGATILLRVEILGQGPLWQLNGPGIDGRVSLAVTGLHAQWIAQRSDWNADFPLGADIILFDDHRFAAMPRTTGMALQEKSPWAM